MGKIRAPYYRIVVADARAKRDGRSIEEIGKYHPTEEPSFIEVDSERAQYWLSVGAQPSPQVEAILKLTGDWGIFKGEKGAKSTVKTKEAKIEFQADEKKKPVLKPKAEKPVEKPAPVEAPAAADEDAAAATGDDAAADAAAAEPAGAEPAVDDTSVAESAVESDGAPDEAPAPDTVDETPAVGTDDAPAADAAAEASADDADKA
jgi:small subunit ribosomal protein S16